MERISWTEKITNVEALKRVGESRTIVDNIFRKRAMGY